MIKKVQFDSFDIVFCKGSKANLILIKKICIYLNTLIEENKLLRNYEEKIKFQSSSIFNDNILYNYHIKDYFMCIQKFLDLDDYILISAVIYIDRFCEKSKIILTQYNLHKLLFSAILLAIKFNEDFYYDTQYCSDVVGITNKKMKNLEYNFYILIDFQLYIEKNEYLKYAKIMNND